MRERCRSRTEAAAAAAQATSATTPGTHRPVGVGRRIGQGSHGARVADHEPGDVEVQQRQLDPAPEPDRLLVRRGHQVVVDGPQVAGVVDGLIDEWRHPQPDGEDQRRGRPPGDAPAWRRAGRSAPPGRASTTIVKTPSPAASPRYGTCVCAQNDAAKTATGNIATSSQATDHTASSSTTHHSNGRYGFHGWVSIVSP